MWKETTFRFGENFKKGDGGQFEGSKIPKIFGFETKANGIIFFWSLKKINECDRKLEMKHR